jgi:uncharacterized damage-inducible protein DinB
MYELFRAYAEYNRAVNEQICSHIRSMDEAKVRAEHATYYKSILTTLLHPLRSDIRWLDRLVPGAGEQFAKVDVDNLTTAEYLRIRPQVDAEIIRVVEAKKAADFGATIRVQCGPTRTVEGPLWKLVLQWFNHQTHHRGQVSVLLDLEGVDNDYSGMLDKI